MICRKFIKAEINHISTVICSIGLYQTTVCCWLSPCLTVFSRINLPAVTFSHFKDSVLVELRALIILNLQRPHLREAILRNVDCWVVESVLESQGANIVVKQGISAVRHSRGRQIGLRCVVKRHFNSAKLKLMVCDKSQQQEIARLQTLFSKVTVSFSVTALMKHQCVSGGVKRRLLHTKSIARH